MSFFKFLPVGSNSCEGGTDALSLLGFLSGGWSLLRILPVLYTHTNGKHSPSVPHRAILIQMHTKTRQEMWIHLQKVTLKPPVQKQAQWEQTKHFRPTQCKLLCSGKSMIYYKRSSWHHNKQKCVFYLLLALKAIFRKWWKWFEIWEANKRKILTALQNYYIKILCNMLLPASIKKKHAVDFSPYNKMIYHLTALKKSFITLWR